MHSNTDSDRIVGGFAGAGSDQSMVFFREEGRWGGVGLVAIKNSTTVENASATIARQLNSNNQIAIKLGGAEQQHQLYITDLIVGNVGEMTYKVTDIPHNYSLNTSAVPLCFHWYTHKDSTGNQTLQFKTGNTIHTYPINKPAPVPTSPKPKSSEALESAIDINIVLSHKLSSTSLAPTSMDKKLLEYAENIDKKLCSSVRDGYKLYRAEKDEEIVAKTIAVHESIIKERSGEIPANSWCLYRIRDEIYHLLHVYDVEPALGQIANIIQQCIDQRAGRPTFSVCSAASLFSEQHRQVVDLQFMSEEGAKLLIKAIVEYNADKKLCRPAEV